jgi:hypothetical protein
MAERTTCRRVSAEGRIRSPLNPYDTFIEKSCTGLHFSAKPSVLFCQYHFTNAPYVNNTLITKIWWNLENLNHSNALSDSESAQD